MAGEIINFEELKKRYHFDGEKETFFRALAEQGYDFMVAVSGQFWAVKLNDIDVRKKTA